MKIFGKQKKEEMIETEETMAEATLADAIAPSALQITSNYVQIGEKYARTFFVITYPRFLTVNWMSPIINLDRIFNVSMFIHPADTGIILKNLNDAEEQIDSFFESKMVYIKPALFQQDIGLNATLPLGNDYLFITNSMNTEPLSTVFPFVSANLSSNKGILYGINRHNNSLIIFDRFSMENGNTVIFGKSGSGKSYGVKVEILRSLMFGTDIIVIDPENEYQYLAETTDGAFFKISLNSKHHINPFDISPPGPDETSEEMIRSKIMDLVGLLRVALGELPPEENSILDRALTEVYAP